MQTLRKYDYARYEVLLIHYAIHLRKNYAKITQIVYSKYADIMQTSLRSNYTIISVLQSLRILCNHYANALRRYTQINYPNHYADYAIITQFNNANTIMQFLKKKSLRRLCKYRFQLRRNSGHYAMGNLLMWLALRLALWRCLSSWPPGPDGAAAAVN